MTDFISPPPINSVLPVRSDKGPTGANSVWTNPWANWFSKAQIILFATSQSGLTADRPTKNLYVGRVYFDESLGANGMPIWVRKDLAGWVKADGTAA